MVRAPTRVVPTAQRVQLFEGRDSSKRAQIIHKNLKINWAHAFARLAAATGRVETGSRTPSVPRTKAVPAEKIFLSAGHHSGKNSAVQTRFLLGPAGSGKTFRCLAEIRQELLRCPDGPPLLLLAPKQATFQLERQLLGSRDPNSGAQLQGYSRLQILSFEDRKSVV